MVSKYIIIYKNAVNNICGGFVMSSLNPSKTYFRKKIYKPHFIKIKNDFDFK